MEEKYMREAIKMASENVKNGGGPFGAVIVKDGLILGRGVNRVTANNDPTAHAEVMAIRDATANAGTHDLEGAIIYTSCEPCPMCLGAIYWAHISHIFYGNNQLDAARIGFDDSDIYKQLALPIDKRRIPETQMLSKEAIETFDLWQATENKQEY
jgi:tRNA(Arg) A34 adenosine deaminase TadA